MAKHGSTLPVEQQVAQRARVMSDMTHVIGSWGITSTLTGQASGAVKFQESGRSKQPSVNQQIVNNDVPPLPMEWYTRLEGLPDALMTAVNALVNETVGAQTRAEQITKRFEKDLERFERDRASQMDSHKESFESMKDRIDALHEKWSKVHSHALHQAGVQNHTKAKETDSHPGVIQVGRRKSIESDEVNQFHEGSRASEGSEEEDDDMKTYQSKADVKAVKSANLHASLSRFEELDQQSHAPSFGGLRRSDSGKTVDTDGAYTSSFSHMQSWGISSVVTKLSAPLRTAHRRPRTLLSKIVAGDIFNGVFSFFIVFNTIMLGIETNFALKKSIEDIGKVHAAPTWEKPVNVTLTSLFVVELLLRLVGERLYFFVGEAKLWNLFDAVMVCAAILDEIFANLGGNYSLLRVIRILRMGRAVRILRVFRFIRDLRVMLASIIASLISLAWAMVLLLILIYCSSVLLCQGVVDHLQETPAMTQREHDGFEEFYGSIGTTMYSHIMAISGGLDWYTLVYPLKIVSSWHAGLFTFYVLFVIFGMLNVLTGVFVDRASELSKMDHDIIIQSQKSKMAEFCLGLKKIFDDIDTDKTGSITWKEFKTYCQREDVLSYMSLMDLNIEESRELFHMLDTHDEGSISIEHFVQGCMRVKGHARSLDVLHIQEELEKVKKMIMIIGDQQISFLQLQEKVLSE